MLSQHPNVPPKNFLVRDPSKWINNSAFGVLFAVSLGLIPASLSVAGVVKLTIAWLLLACVWVCALGVTFLLPDLWRPTLKSRLIFGAVSFVCFLLFGYGEYRLADTSADEKAAITQTVSGKQNGPVIGTIKNNGTLAGAVNNYVVFQNLDNAAPVLVPQVEIKGLSAIGDPTSPHRQGAFALQGDPPSGMKCGGIRTDNVEITGMTGSAIEIPACATADLNNTKISDSAHGVVQRDPRAVVPN